MHDVLVCNPRRNALLREGSKSDKVEARKLAELLAGCQRRVYQDLAAAEDGSAVELRLKR